MRKPKAVETNVEKGWRTELFIPKHGWTETSSRPVNKIRARNAARTWKNVPNTKTKYRARIVQVTITTETLAREEV